MTLAILLGGVGWDTDQLSSDQLQWALKVCTLTSLIRVSAHRSRALCRLYSSKNSLGPPHSASLSLL